MSGEPAAGPRGAIVERSSARLAAVQALFQIELTGRDPAEVIAEFDHHRLGAEVDGTRLATVERRWFADVVAGSWARCAELDPLIAATLAAGWTLERLGPLLRAIFRAAAYELVCHDEVPPRVIVSEYVDVAQAFHGAAELAFVNAALDKLGRRLRPLEMVGESGGEPAAAG